MCSKACVTGDLHERMVIIIIIIINSFNNGDLLVAVSLRLNIYKYEEIYYNKIST